MLERIRISLPSSLENNSEKTAFLTLAGCIAFSLISIAVCQILLAVALAASIQLVRNNKKLLLSMKGVLIPLILFCLWNILAALMATDVGLALTITKKFFLYLLVVLVPVVVQGKDRIVWIYKAVFAAAVLSALAGIYQDLTGIKGYDLLHRITGFVGHWMTFSGLLMLALVLLTAYGLRASRRLYLAWIPTAALIALAIVLSQTRNAVLGAYIGIAALLVLGIFREKKMRFVVYFSCLILLTIAMYLAAPASIRQRFRSGLDPADDNTRNRIELLDTSLRMIRNNPWFGVGPQNVKFEALKYRNRNDFPDILYIHMHNNILQIASSIGIPGLLIWLWFMIRLAWDALCRYRLPSSGSLPDGGESGHEAVLVSSAALGCWAALMIAGMFEYNFGDSEVLTLFLFIVSAPYVFSPKRPIEKSGS